MTLDTEEAEERIISIRKKIFSNTVLDGYSHTVGLKNEGTVIATGTNENGKCNVKNWTDIIAVSAGFNHTVG
ncbi:MAG: hypothetical protein LUH47_07345, partial [Clostridiales bacterium]|nr:hypothetical protein [Clostridiales bacterium]